MVGWVKLLSRKACVCMHLHRSKQCSSYTYRKPASYSIDYGFVFCVAHACAFYHLFGKLMKTSLVQGKAPSRAAINAAEVSSCLLVINASSNRERLHVAKPASICIRLLEQWLLIMAGREGCLRWREASMSYLGAREVWKLSFDWKLFQKWVFSLHLPLPHPHQQLQVVSVLLYSCSERLHMY